MVGQHCLKAWSKTQSIIAKSSGESELFGVIKGSTEGLGLVSMALDFGNTMSVRVHVDANAAKGIVERRGLSRVRHIEVDNLWIQEKEARRMLPLSKVAGGENPADLMTKNVGIELAMKHMKAMGIRFAEGRSKAAAQLHLIENNFWEKGEGDMNVKIIKVHQELRYELFTPGGKDNENCPARACDLESVRKTVGTTESGKKFEIEDNWKRPGRAHRQVEERWTGHTEFTVKPTLRTTHTSSPRAFSDTGRTSGSFERPSRAVRYEEECSDTAGISAIYTTARGRLIGRNGCTYVRADWKAPEPGVRGTGVRDAPDSILAQEIRVAPVPGRADSRLPAARICAW